MSLRRPAPLGIGARVALVSPSGPLRDVTELVRAEANVRLFGWEPVVGPHAMSCAGYFAGTDAERAADLAAAIADPGIDGIWCLRGGYGAARLLPMLDPESVRANCKTLIGYSDITALHALWQQVGLVSFHGPTARGEFTPFSLDSFRRAVAQGMASTGIAPDATVVRAGRATGRLSGGNLSLVASLTGTPWALDFRDAIVVLEDVNEATYRIDRMLTQLRQAGAFHGCAGLALGHFSQSDDSSERANRTLLEVVTECAEALDVPALLGIPCGHIDDQWTFPFGATATLDASARAVTIHP